MKRISRFEKQDNYLASTNHKTRSIGAKVIPFDYQGQPIRFDMDGWINATQAAARFDKLPNEWLRLPETIAYLEAIERTCGKIPHVKTSRARIDRGGGTWLHPRLAIAFARWLSPDFAVWCDLQLDALLHAESVVRRGLEQAHESLEERRIEASKGGANLARWRWDKPALEQATVYWRGRMQLCLWAEESA
jgi:hypothetical protein